MSSANLVYPSQLPQVEVVGAPVTALVFQDQIEEMLTRAKQRSNSFVCVANVHMLMEARCNKLLKAALRRADIVTPDGMPLVWMMKLLGHVIQDRVAGMDIFMAVCQRSMEEDIAIYLLGSTQQVLEQMRVRLKKDFPTLKVAGIESPPFRPLTENENIELIERINSSGAGITFVSLGCPKQECWMESNYDHVKSVMIGVGGVFPVYAGLQRYAPKLIRDMGLEWLYRLIQEPRRLFKRYLTTIPPFIWLAFHQVLQEQKHKIFPM